MLREGEPALASLNDALPAVRAFAREALPGVRSTPATLDAATPFLRQVRGLVSRDELRGLVADLRPAIPDLARMTRRTIPLLEEVRPLGSCVNEVLVPWSQTVVPDEDNQTINGDGSVARLYEETDYAVEGLSGFSRSGDANGPYARVLGMSGPNIVSTGADRFASSAVPLLGALPALDSSLKAPFRPDVGCETQDPPNLSSNPGALPDPDFGRSLGGRLVHAEDGGAGRGHREVVRAGGAAQPQRESQARAQRRRPPRREPDGAQRGAAPGFLRGR